MFLGFANIYRRFIKSLNKIVASLTLILKTTVLSIPAYLARTRTDENKFGIDGSGSINGSRIDNRIANLLSSTKKISSGVGFLTPEASLTFT